jgi:hypothetical protein
MLSASLRAGVFDTNVSILHTCSLPDLRSLFSTVPQVLLPTAVEGGAPDNQELNEESDQEEEGEESESDAVQEPASKLEEGSEGEESQGDDEVREDEEDSEEEGWSSSTSDDEDIHQLVQTLQSYVEESSMSVMDTIVMCNNSNFNGHRISSTYTSCSFSKPDGDRPAASH